jgi:hypothetical protein
MKNTILGSVAVIVAVVGAALVTKSVPVVNVTTPTPVVNVEAPKVTVQSPDVNVPATVVNVPKQQTLGAVTGTENYNYTNFFNGLFATKFTQGGGVLRFTATSTQNKRTLTEAELKDNAVIEILATNSPALALTLPATSTMTTLLPNAGDSRTWIIDNQQAAATTTTITAGVGIDLIAYTTNDDVIDGLEVSMLTCWRKYNTDVYCLTSELLKAD